MRPPRSIRSALPILLALVALSTAAPARARAAAGEKPVLDFIADDYVKALAEARARKLPLFIESWAPW